MFKMWKNFMKQKHSKNERKHNEMNKAENTTKCDKIPWKKIILSPIKLFIFSSPWLCVQSQAPEWFSA